MRTVPKMPLVVGGLVLVVSGVGVVLGVLWLSGGDSTTSDPEAATTPGTAGLGPGGAPAPATTTTPAVEADRPATTRPEVDLAELRDAIAQGFYDDFTPLVDHEEADCLAQAVLDVFTVERLYELHQSMASSGVFPDVPDLWPTTPAEREELDRRMRPCVPTETATRLNL